MGGIACVLVKCWMVDGVEGACEGIAGACGVVEGAARCGVVEGAGVLGAGGKLGALGERRPLSLWVAAGGRLEPGVCADGRPAGSLVARGRADAGISGGGEDTPDSLKMRR